MSLTSNDQSTTHKQSYASECLRLEPTTLEHIDELMKWFSSKDDVMIWGGPGIRFPLEKASFCEDIKYSTLLSYSLVDNEKLLGFGQIYSRLNRCHLGRLIINPTYRSQGLGRKLIQDLCKEGTAQLKLTTYSLFVLEHNKVAKSLYQSMGFSQSQYPKEIPLKSCQYMTTDHVNLARKS